MNLLGIPVDFILFGFTLLGVALFHRHTLPIAISGLAVITAYKLAFTGFKTGAGLAGLVLHLEHEWVILANLFLLLMGFALLSRHFELSRVPDEMPAFLPDDWKGALILLVMVAVLSSFLDNIAAALIGGTMARYVFRGKVHIGYLAAIVAAANAGGAGSVVGDTTTTMMWIAGVSPLSVLEAYIAAGVALAIFAVPAAIQQHRYSPIVKQPPRDLQIEWTRLGIVVAILLVAIGANVLANLKFPELLDAIPVIGLSVWAVILLAAPLRQPDWAVMPETFKGTIFLLALVTSASMMPVEALPASGWQTALGLGFRVGRVRQHSAHRARAQAGRLRLGLPRLCGRFWRLDDLVRLVRRRRAIEHVSGGEVGRPVAAPRLACGGRLCDRICGDARRAWLAPGSAAARVKTVRGSARPARKYDALSRRRRGSSATTASSRARST